MSSWQMRALERRRSTPMCRIGSTRRIVVYDTLLEQAPDREIEEVVAHELGHVKTHDVVIRTLFGAMGVAAAVIGLYLLVQVIPLGRLTGVDDLGDGRSVAFLLAFVAVVGFVGLPIQNAVSRNIEARADLSALNLTSKPQAFAELQRRLAVTAKADVTPNPLLFTWFGSHPSTAQRLAMGRGWAAEHGAVVPAPLADSDSSS